MSYNSRGIGDGFAKIYPKVRTKSGKLYAKSSLCAIRFGLCRHLKQVLKVDIIKDKEFNEANRIYEAQCVELKKQGPAKIEHKPSIADECIKKLYQCAVFNKENLYHSTKQADFSLK